MDFFVCAASEVYFDCERVSRADRTRRPNTRGGHFVAEAASTQSFARSAVREFKHSLEAADRTRPKEILL